MLPEQDVEIVQDWAANRFEPELRSQVRIEVDVGRHSLTLYECRPPWREDLGPEWTRVGFARLTYTRNGDEWYLECIDGGDEFRPYAYAPVTKDINQLLAAIDDDPTGIFWG